MQKGMFYGEGAHIFEKAKALRNNLTHAEMALWNYLKNNPEGYKFRRQHPVWKYIVDFYCHALRLVIEVDGSIHDENEIKEYDIERENNLKELGLIVIRFTNNQVENDFEAVIMDIEKLLINKKPL